EAEPDGCSDQPESGYLEDATDLHELELHASEDRGSDSAGDSDQPGHCREKHGGQKRSVQMSSHAEKQSYQCSGTGEEDGFDEVIHGGLSLSVTFCLRFCRRLIRRLCPYRNRRDRASPRDAGYPDAESERARSTSR